MQAPVTFPTPRRREGAARTAPRWLTAALVVLCAPAIAQPVAVPAPQVHRVAAGDTLSNLALQYGGSAHLWPQLQGLNGLSNPNRLSTGSLLRLPTHWAGAHQRLVDVAFVRGDAFVSPPSDGGRVPMVVGQTLAEGSLIEVGPDSAVHLRLSDGSSMQLAPGTRIRLVRARALATSDSTDTRWSLEQGRVDNQVNPRRSRGRRFEIRTPYAVASVRGTTFGVSVVPGEGAHSEVYSGQVELRRAGARPVQVRAGEGAQASKRGLEAALALPAAPALPASLHDQIVSGQALTLELPAPPENTRWRVRLTPVDEPTQVLREAAATGTLTTWATLPAGEYLVWVQAREARGLLGPATGARWRLRALPPAPWYETPAADERVAGPAVDLRCTQPLGAQAFRLQIASDADFQSLVSEQAELTACAYRATLAPGRYHWRVASVARDAQGQVLASPYSAGRAFEVLPPAPSAPATRAQDLDGALQVHWDPQPGWTYRVQVSDRPGFERLLHDAHTGAPSLLLPNWPAGNYLVRVQAIDARGQRSPFSAAQAVQVGLTWRSGDGLVWQGTGPVLANPSTTR